MNAQQFIDTKPCLEEVDGWLLGRKIQGLPLADVIRPIEAYKNKLLEGKVEPAPSGLRRKWVYKKGRRPKHNNGSAAQPLSFDISSRKKK